MYAYSISWVQSLSDVRLFAAPWTAARQASLSITNSWSLLKLMSIESVMHAIQPSHPLPSPSPPTFNLSQYQGLFQWVNSSHQVAKVLELHLQHQSFQWIFRTDPLGLTGLTSLLSEGLSRVFSNTTVQKHQWKEEIRSIQLLRSWRYMESAAIQTDHLKVNIITARATVKLS